MYFFLNYSPQLYSISEIIVDSWMLTEQMNEWMKDE